jgi:hypothetical protein
MIQVYNDPTLLDFIKVCWQMPQDERDQLEAFTGEPYNIDGAALGNFMAPGPKWVLKVGDDPICIGGYAPQRPGVYRDWMINTPEAFSEKNWFGVTRIARRTMDWILHNGAHRVECVCLASREAKNSRWYKLLGYNREATLYGYCASGADAVMFSRVRH